MIKMMKKNQLNSLRPEVNNHNLRIGSLKRKRDADFDKLNNNSFEKFSKKNKQDESFVNRSYEDKKDKIVENENKIFEEKPLENNLENKLLEDKTKNKTESSQPQFQNPYALKLILKETKQVPLSKLLEKIRMYANAKTTREGRIVYKIYLNDGSPITITRNIVDAEKIFSDANFLANYFVAFRANFKTMPMHSIFPGIKIYINNDLSNNQQPSINYDEILDFKFLTCLFFGLIFNIQLEDCICYPSNIQELIAQSAGISKNCTNNECFTKIRNNPHLFDPLVMTYCSDIQQINYSFIMLNILGRNNNIKISVNQKNN
jgi:hypothetical protein